MGEDAAVGSRIGIWGTLWIGRLRGKQIGRKERLISLFRRRKFTILEETLLQSLCKALSPSSAHILQQQLEGVDHVRRMPGYREILCYEKKERVPGIPTFQDNRAELKFASMTFSVEGR